MRPDPALERICARLAEDVRAASVLVLDNRGAERARVGAWDDAPSLRAISRFAIGERGILVVGWSCPPPFGIERALTLARHSLESALSSSDDSGAIQLV